MIALKTRITPHLAGSLGSIALLAGLLAATPASATAPDTTWDLTVDYGTVDGNPNGDWTYGWTATLGSALTLYDTVNGTQWYDSAHHSGDLTPAVWKNGSGGAAYGIPSGAVALHPGWDGSFSVIRWTAPQAMTVTISAYFGAGDWGAMSDYVLVNGVTAQQWLSNGGSASFSFQRTLAAGDTVDFVVGVPIGGGYGFGNTEIAATISAVPEGGTAALLLAGLGVVGLGARRRRSTP